jgi:hypothetical protein
MFNVTSRVDGSLRKHHVKPLELIWREFKKKHSIEYGPHNTVHVDDLGR